MPAHRRRRHKRHAPAHPRRKLRKTATAFASIPFYRYFASSTSPRYTHTPSERELRMFRDELLSLTNNARRRYGVRPVHVSPKLTAIAKAHTKDQGFHIGRCSHRGSNGSSLADRMRKGGYRFRYVSENVAHGQRDAKHVFRSLMNSRGHRRNILSSNVVDTGVYVCKGADEVACLPQRGTTRQTIVTCTM